MPANKRAFFCTEYGRSTENFYKHTRTKQHFSAQKSVVYIEHPTRPIPTQLRFSLATNHQILICMRLFFTVNSRPLCRAISVSGWVQPFDSKSLMTADVHSRYWEEHVFENATLLRMIWSLSMHPWRFCAAHDVASTWMMLVDFHLKVTHSPPVGQVCMRKHENQNNPNKEY